MSNVLIILICSLCSLSSLGYELALSNYISRLTGYEVWGQSFTLGVYLIFMGVGAFFYEHRKLKLKKLQFLKLEALIFVIGILTPFYLEITNSILILANIISGMTPAIYQLSLKVTVAFIPTCLIGFLTGFELPIIFQQTKRYERNYIIFFSYCGSLLAGLIVSGLLMEGFSYFNMFIAFSAINLCVCMLILLWQKKYIMFLLCTILMPVFVLAINIFPEVKRVSTYISHYDYKIQTFSITNIKNILNVVQNIGDIAVVNTPYQKNELVKSFKGKSRYAHKDSIYRLLLNGHIQFGTNKEKVYHQTFVIGALNLIGKIPRRVTILGGGDGILAHELLKYKEIEEIVLVELDPDMIKFSNENKVISKLNHHSLHSSRVEIINEDAFSYISKQKSNSAELLLIDFPYPNSSDLKKLFSVEFYRFVKKVIGSDGFAVLDAPIYRDSRTGILKEGSKNILSTLYFVDFKQFFAFGPYTPFVFLSNGIKQPKFDYEKLTKNPNLDNVALINLVEIEISKSSLLPLNFKYVNSVMKPIRFGNE